MRGILHFHKTVFRKVSVLLIFSFFASGCHTDSEPFPAPPVVANEEKNNYREAKEKQFDRITETAPGIQNTNIKPETPVKIAASGILLPENKDTERTASGSKSIKKKDHKAFIRDPFTLPAEFKEQKDLGPHLKDTVSKTQQTTKQAAFIYNSDSEDIPSGDYTAQSKIPATPPAYAPASGDASTPCVIGIFDNGKEKFALLHWHSIQGIFRSGEQLRNGYYVKEITASSVLLSPDHSQSGRENITLLLH